MRFSQVAVLAASIFGLAQGLVVPETSGVNARDATAGEIFARADVKYTCPLKNKKDCLSCPKTTKQKAKGKREDATELVARAEQEIPFDQINDGSWGDDDELLTKGLSVCSVLAVYDKTKWVFAHVPPARLEQKGDGSTEFKTGEDVLKEYLASLTKTFDGQKQKDPIGYLLVSTQIDPERRQQMEQWFRDNKITPKVDTYSYDANHRPEGTLTISRANKKFPPVVTFK